MSRDKGKKLSKDSNQIKLTLPHEEVLEFSDPLYYKFERTKIGKLSKLALESGDSKFKAVQEEGDIYKLTNNNGTSFLAELKQGKGKNKGTYKIKGCVSHVDGKLMSYFKDVKINGTGELGWSLRPAQIGAIYSLLAHWSLNKDVSTVVLPTGTGKTETMLVATLADQAIKTLVVVPTVDLKNQIAEKFSTWGILRKLGVITEQTPNPTVSMSIQNWPT